ncbi:YgjV family protein [Chelativorans sp. YIM 93263]|uniref:YgjV family protein n=1 Tax=Chelativorans sp. YIM 93263 TaxID=2906648 RepID=UPI0023790BD4|nr:YgjV family protein [Chelativorans sp. YIM 93263]
MVELFTRAAAGQLVGLIALVLCIVAFASKRDDRLLFILIFANVAFAVQFALFEAWVAAGISALIIVRITLARRMEGNWIVMSAMLIANVLVAWATWEEIVDIVPLAAGVLGTVAMFMLRGVPMRCVLAVAALCWVAANAISGSAGAMIAEILIFFTNVVTIVRLIQDRRADRGRTQKNPA